MPDLEDLEMKLKTGNYQLVLLIHYFGQSQVNPENFVQLCHQYGAKVIEDCAHTLLGGLSGRLLGSFGDYSIFSIHKSIATKDGGFYIDNKGDLNNLTQSNKAAISMSTLEIFANSELTDSAKQRLKNYKKVSEWVSQYPELQLFFSTVHEGMVPLNCPLIVQSGKREALYFKLIENGVLPTALYHTLIPEICQNKFPKSYETANNILNLPTHSDIGEEDYIIYENILKRSIQEVYSNG